MELADALERRGCPRDAAWQLAKGELELRAALDAADREPVSDLSGSMIHIWKGIEILLADRFGRPLKQMRDRRLLELKGYLDSLGAFAAALAQAVVRLHGRWPSEVPGLVDPRDREDSGIRVRPGGQPEPVLSNAIRLAWTATCVRFVAVVLRNGYTHIVSSWAQSSDEVRVWCSHDKYPVPPEVIAGWGRQDGVTPYALQEAGRPVAYGELWIDRGEQEVELARLIVEPSQRSRGIGRRLASGLAARASQIYPRVFVRVHPENIAAQRCYAGAGFTRVSTEDERRWNGQQPVSYVWMQYHGHSRNTSSMASS